MATYAVTGATGFLGKWLVRQLIGTSPWNSSVRLLVAC